MQTPQPFNKVTCFGAGFVGTPTTAVLALKNPNAKFYVFDINKTLIEKWNTGCPIYEQGLEEIINKVRNVNLFFTHDLQVALQDVDAVYIAVATPTKTFGEGKDKCYDLSYIESVARSISYFFKNTELKKQLVVLQKSTVPVFTHKAVSDILRQNQTIESNKDKFVVISNPEFLAEGTTVHDLLYPDRIVYGSSNRDDIIDRLALLHPHVPSQKIIRTSTITSELSKLVSNCFLAQRISSINSIGLLVEKIGGDVLEIKKCIGADTRIGNKFINPSVGFGGSCFKKDVLALIYLAETHGLNQVADYWNQVIVMNEYRKKRFFNVILEKMYNTVRNKKFGILGLSFKKGTNDVRDSAAAKVCQLLLEQGAILQIYDPMISRQKFIEELKYQRLWKESFNDKLIEMKSVSEAVQDTHALVILTEWDEFITEDYRAYYQRMHKPSYIFDGRNILNEKEVTEIGFKYFRIGHKH